MSRTADQEASLCAHQHPQSTFQKENLSFPKPEVTPLGFGLLEAVGGSTGVKEVEPFTSFGFFVLFCFFQSISSYVEEALEGDCVPTGTRR